MITSTMINTGIPGGASAMSRTVGLPVAIAAKLIAEGKINHYGVIIPIYKEIYGPILAELKTMNIKFEEKKVNLPYFLVADEKNQQPQKNNEKKG